MHVVPRKHCKDILEFMRKIPWYIGNVPWYIFLWDIISQCKELTHWGHLTHYKFEAFLSDLQEE